MNKLTDKWYLLPIILVVLMLIGNQSKAQDTGQAIGQAIGQVDTTQVKALLEAYGVKHVDIVLRQSILETWWYKCKNCSLDNNNLFGFLYKGKYLKFDTWEDSVKYYHWWQEQLYKGGDYYAFLKRIGYATEPTYINRLKQLY